MQDTHVWVCLGCTGLHNRGQTDAIVSGSCNLKSDILWQLNCGAVGIVFKLHSDQYLHYHPRNDLIIQSNSNHTHCVTEVCKIRGSDSSSLNVNIQLSLLCRLYSTVRVAVRQL